MMQYLLGGWVAHRNCGRNEKNAPEESRINQCSVNNQIASDFSAGCACSTALISLLGSAALVVDGSGIGRW